VEFEGLQKTIIIIIGWAYFEWMIWGVTVIVGFWIGRLSKKRVKKTTVVIEKPRAQKFTDTSDFVERVKANIGG